MSDLYCLRRFTAVCLFLLLQLHSHLTLVCHHLAKFCHHSLLIFLLLKTALGHDLRFFARFFSQRLSPITAHAIETQG